MIGRRINESRSKLATILNSNFEEVMRLTSPDLTDGEVISLSDDWSYQSLLYNTDRNYTLVPSEWQMSGQWLYHDDLFHELFWDGPSVELNSPLEGRGCCYIPQGHWIEQPVDITNINSIAFDVTRFRGGTCQIRVYLDSESIEQQFEFYKEGSKQKYMCIDTSAYRGIKTLRIMLGRDYAVIDNIRVNTMETPITEILLPLSYGNDVPGFINGGFDGSLEGWTSYRVSLDYSWCMQGFSGLTFSSNGYASQAIDLTKIKYIYFYTYGYTSRYVTILINDVVIHITPQIPIRLIWERHYVDVSNYTGVHTVKFQGSSNLLAMDYVHTSNYLLD